MMWGMNDLDTALFIAWFLLAMVWSVTLIYYLDELDYRKWQASYYKDLWRSSENYTQTLMRLYRGELMTEEEEAEEEIQIDTGE